MEYTREVIDATSLENIAHLMNNEYREWKIIQVFKNDKLDFSALIEKELKWKSIKEFFTIIEAI